MQVGSRDLQPQAIELRVMTEADLGGADLLRQLAGWNQTLGDWRRQLELEPGGCFVAIHKGVLAGTVTTIVYGEQLAWIGMMLVHPDHRRNGIATCLMRHALEYLRHRGVACVKLDATPAGQSLYEQLGFSSEWSLQRWQRAACPPVTRRPASPEVRGFKHEDWSFVLAIDEAAFGVGRPDLLWRLSEQSRCASVWPAGGTPSCWGLLRGGADSDYLGPLVCGDEEGATALVKGLLAHSPDRTVTWDIPDSNVLAKSIAQSLGFSPLRLLTRMRLGPPVEAAKPHTLFGIADPAVG